MLCNRCRKADWIGPKFSRISAPYPDPHYPASSFQDTKIDPWIDSRTLDDLVPRANIRKLFTEGYTLCHQATVSNNIF